MQKRVQLKNFLVIGMLVVMLFGLNGCKEQSKDLRVVISSDIHYQTDVNCHGIDMKKRAQHWVDSILKEHEEHPIDLLVINGDLSLDYENVFDNSIFTTGISRTKQFLEEYLTQLPEDLPVFVMPGNHELYSDKEWFEMTGNHRQGYMVVKDTLFLFMDNYSSVLGPEKDQEGVYTATDVAYIEEKMKEYPEHDVYIVSHYIDKNNESAEFRQLVAENARIKSLFAGHTHEATVMQLGAYWGNKTIAQTGNFSYSFSKDTTFWGFRELIVTPEEAYSQYVIVESDVIVDGREVHFNRTTKDLVKY